MARCGIPPEMNIIKALNHFIAVLSAILLDVLPFVFWAVWFKSVLCGLHHEYRLESIAA
jgi:hypothetical protein